MKRHRVKQKEYPKLNVYKQNGINKVFRNILLHCAYHRPNLGLTPGIIHLTKYIHNHRVNLSYH